MGGIAVAFQILIAFQPKVLWSKSFGGPEEERARWVEISRYGGYIIAGFTQSEAWGGRDMYLLRLDSKGNLVWDKRIGGHKFDKAYSCVETEDGSIYVVGYTTSYGEGHYDVYLIKVSKEGKIMWERTYGGKSSDQAYSICETRDGNFILVGQTQSYGAGASDVYLLKVDREGNLLWEKTFGGGNADVGRWVEETHDGGFIIVGETWSYGKGNGDIYLIKTDSLGNLIWQRTWGWRYYEWGSFVKETKDKGYALVGFSRSFGRGRAGDMIVIRTDSLGSLRWLKTFGGLDEDGGYCLSELKDGGFLVTGYARSFGDGKGDIYLVRIDKKGNLVWEKTFGGEDEDRAFCLKVEGRNLIICGFTRSYGEGKADAYILKIRWSK